MSDIASTIFNMDLSVEDITNRLLSDIVVTTEDCGCDDVNEVPLDAQIDNAMGVFSELDTLYSDIDVIHNNITEAGTINQQVIGALALTHPGLIPNEINVKSYTIAPSRVNLNITLEAIDAKKATIIAVIIGAVATLLKALFKKVTSSKVDTKEIEAKLNSVHKDPKFKAVFVDPFAGKLDKPLVKLGKGKLQLNSYEHYVVNQTDKVGSLLTGLIDLYDTVIDIMQLTTDRFTDSIKRNSSKDDSGKLLLNEVNKISKDVNSGLFKAYRKLAPSIRELTDTKVDDESEVSGDLNTILLDIGKTINDTGPLTIDKSDTNKYDTMVVKFLEVSVEFNWDKLNEMGEIDDDIESIIKEIDGSFKDKLKDKFGEDKDVKIALTAYRGKMSTMVAIAGTGRTMILKIINSIKSIVSKIDKLISSTNTVKADKVDVTVKDK